MSTLPPLSHLDQTRLDALADSIVAAGIYDDPENAALPVISMAGARWFRDTMIERKDEFYAALEAAAKRAGVPFEEVRYNGFAVRSEVLGGLLIFTLDGPGFIPDEDYVLDPGTMYQEFEEYESPEQAA